MATRHQIRTRVTIAAASDPRVKDLVARLAGDPDARVGDLPDELLIAAYEQMARIHHTGLDEALFERAMTETAPVRFTTARRTGLTDIMALPEITQFLNEGWCVERPARGPVPAYAEAKALLCTLGLDRRGSHLTQAHQALATDATLRGLLLPGQAGIGSYSALVSQAQKVAPACTPAAIATNIALAKSLRETYPQTAKRLLIDGTPIPAWCPQRGSSGNVELEELYRAKTPEAGFRVYTQTASGKVAPGPGGRVTRAWRWYYLVAITDQATGIPLVWHLQDASQDEARALAPLLAHLHELWPDIDAEVIVGDSAWDEDWACELCEVRYGIHPIFPLHRIGTREHSLTRAEAGRGSVRGIDPHGRLVCAAHGAPLALTTVDQPSRAGLAPGEPTPAAKHRVRAECTHATPGAPACGKVGLPMARDWSKLAYYPHHPEGAPSRYAYRVACSIRRNSAESLNARLKVAHHIGTEGANRTRVTDVDTHLALLSLCLLSCTARTVAAARAVQTH